MGDCPREAFLPDWWGKKAEKIAAQLNRWGKNHFAFLPNALVGLFLTQLFVRSATMGKTIAPPRREIGLATPLRLSVAVAIAFQTAR
jgi:hypothetical protein